MKKVFLLILLIPLATLPLRAQTNEIAQSEASESVVSSPETPAPPKPEAPVKVDQTRSHGGGSNPAGINIPHPPFGSSHSGDWSITHWIPIVALIMVFGAPVAIVGMFFYFRHRKNQMLHETLRAMVEKGTPIPPELLADPLAMRAAQLAKSEVRKRNDLRNGLILIGVGAGVSAVAGKPGLIILFIGVAMIVASFFEKKEKPSASANQ